MLIRRETERDVDVVRAITAAAFAQGRHPSQVVPEARLVDELRADPAWIHEPLVALIGDPAYYRRFGFELSTVYQIIPPRPEWQPHFQVRVLSGYQPRLRGMFRYPEPFDRT